MRQRILWVSLTSTLALVSCISDDSEGAAAVNRSGGNTIDQSAYESAYRASLTSDQIQADLQLLASQLDALESFEEGTEDPVMARRSVAASECQTMRDSTMQYIDEDGASVTESVQWFASNGSLLVICQDMSYDEYAATLENSKMVASMQMTSSSLNMDLDATYVLHDIQMTSDGEFLGMGMDVDELATITAASGFKVDMVMQGALTYSTDPYYGDAQIAADVDLTFYFLSGRYRCGWSIEDDYFDESDAIDMNQCVLTHNGVEVGSMAEGADGSMILLDANGNVIQPED